MLIFFISHSFIILGLRINLFKFSFWFQFSLNLSLFVALIFAKMKCISSKKGDGLRLHLLTKCLSSYAYISHYIPLFSRYKVKPFKQSIRILFQSRPNDFTRSLDSSSIQFRFLVFPSILPTNL